MNVFNDLYGKYHLNIPWGFSGMDSEVGFFLETFGHEIGQNTIDVGCGYANISRWFNERGKNYHGIDIAEVPVAFNLSHFATDHVTFSCMSVLDISEDKKFDCIIDIGCLHCLDVQEQKSVLEKYHQILNDNGLICLRYFENNYQKPLFFVDDIPIWGTHSGELLDFFKKIYTIRYIYRDIKSFDMCNRVTIILQKDIYV